MAAVVQRGITRPAALPAFGGASLRLRQAQLLEKLAEVKWRR
jgi:hypothetical protein